MCTDDEDGLDVGMNITTVFFCFYPLAVYIVEVNEREYNNDDK
jgi:hypothetical protein